MSTFGDIAGGAATGGLYNAAQAAGVFDPHTTTQVGLMDPAQQAARNAVMGFANTGTFGDFTAGQAVPLGYGNFNMTAPEQAGQSALSQLLNMGSNPAYDQALTSLGHLSASNPNDINSMMTPFAAGVQKQVSQSQADLKRATGAMGGLYSTDTVKGLGNIEAQGNQTIAEKLAELTNQQMDRSLTASQAMSGVAGARQNAALSQIDASQKYGDLARSLNDASIKARDQELLRRRQELMMPLQAAEGLAGSNVQFGVPSVTTSPFQQLMSTVGQVGGQYAGNYAGTSGMMAAMG